MSGRCHTSGRCRLYLSRCQLSSLGASGCLPLPLAIGLYCRESQIGSLVQTPGLLCAGRRGVWGLPCPPPRQEVQLLFAEPWAARLCSQHGSSWTPGTGNPQGGRPERARRCPASRFVPVLPHALPRWAPVPVTPRWPPVLLGSFSLAAAGLVAGVRQSPCAGQLCSGKLCSIW